VVGGSSPSRPANRCRPYQLQTVMALSPGHKTKLGVFVLAQLVTLQNR
jgi:hypothetical protein